jgi:hypothetical protein
MGKRIHVLNIHAKEVRFLSFVTMSVEAWPLRPFAVLLASSHCLWHLPSPGMAKSFAGRRETLTVKLILL